jgi:hypothetical protein
MTAHNPPRIGKRGRLDHIPPKGTVADGNKAQIASVFGDGHEELLRHLNAALGIEGARFAAGLLDQIVTFCSDGSYFDKGRYTFIVAALVTGKPRNHVQAMVILEKATMHLLYMKYAGLLAYPENPVQAELFVGILSKIARVFLAQCEALHRSQEQPIVEGVAQGARERAVDHTANGARVPPSASDAPVVPGRELSAQPRLRYRPVNNGK